MRSTIFSQFCEPRQVGLEGGVEVTVDFLVQLGVTIVSLRIGFSGIGLDGSHFSAAV
jgi:hypothetical protein